MTKKGKKRKWLLAAVAIVAVIIILAGFFYYDYVVKPSNAGSSIKLTMTLYYANGGSWTPSAPHLSMVNPLSAELSIATPSLPLTIFDPSKGETVTGYNVNLDLVPTYSIASGASISSWSFTGTSTVQLETSSGSPVAWAPSPLPSGASELSAGDGVSVPLSCPPTETNPPTSTLTSSGVSQIMFSSTGTFTGNTASTNTFYGVNFVNGNMYNYVFTLNSGATFTITDSYGNTATYTTTSASTLTWQFEYVRTTIQSLSMVWAGSSIT